MITSNSQKEKCSKLISSSLSAFSCLSTSGKLILASMNTTLTLFCKKLPTSVIRCRMIKQTIVKRHLFCAISHGFDKLMKYGKDVINDKEVNTIPNIITFSRIAASPALAVAIAYDMKTPALIGCLLFGFSDWLDGYLARTLNQRTVLGAFLDPLADKVMIAAVSAGLACNGLIPLPLLAAIIGRDAVLLACSFVMRGLEKPKDAPFFDTTYSATFEIIPSDLSKINTAVQFVLLSTTLSQFICGVPSLTMIEPIWYITATTTIYSGLGYLDGSGLRRLSKAGVGQGEKMAKIKQLFRNRINQEKE